MSEEVDEVDDSSDSESASDAPTGGSEDTQQDFLGPETDLDDLDPEDIDWEEYDDYFQDRSVESVESGVVLDASEEDATDSEQVRPPEDSEDHVVPTRSYCQNCEHFSAPPEAHCNHEGTEIVEFIDLDHARVRNCPVVAERQSVVERTDRSMSTQAFEN